MRNQRGFTLLEIMIAIAILSGLSLMTAQAIQNALANRTKFSKQIKDDAVVRDVLRVMERDIALAFHHRDIFTAMQNEIEQERLKSVTGGGTLTPEQLQQQQQQQLQSGAIKPIPKNLTAFIGETTSVHFTTLANVRTYLDSPESEQSEVGYSVRSCRSRKPKPGNREAGSSQCLVRRSTPYLDDDVTKGGKEIVLVENVKEFKLRYFGPERDDWVEVWKTGQNGDAISKENFPLAVEITLTVHDEADPKARAVSMLLVAPVRFPNNPPKKRPGEGLAGGFPGGGGQ